MNAVSPPSYTLVSCHFGDPFWITHMLKQVDALSDERIARVVLVDQSRESGALLATLPRVDLPPFSVTSPYPSDLPEYGSHGDGAAHPNDAENL